MNNEPKFNVGQKVTIKESGATAYISRVAHSDFGDFNYYLRDESFAAVYGSYYTFFLDYELSK